MKIRAVLLAATGLLLAGCGLDGSLGVDLNLLPEMCLEPGETGSETIAIGDLPSAQSELTLLEVAGPEPAALQVPVLLSSDSNEVSLTATASDTAAFGNYQVTYKVEKPAGPIQKAPIAIIIGECQE